ncbi:MAG: CBS domain-containing protein [Pseudorhodobacter sp.]|nr:CBS domain-containing protein [Pseudorhodobacter sp.]
MLVSQILKSKSDDGVVTMPPESPLSKVAELLSSRRIGAVVISTDGKVVLGILSERDVVRELGRRGAACLADTAGAVMTTKVTTCARDDMADDVLQLMTDGRFRHLPVVEQGQMIGLISIGDVVKARLGELSMEKNALERMVKGY